MLFIYFMILLLMLYFVYLLVKFSGTEKSEYDLQYFREQNSIEYPVIIAGYLNKRKVKTEHFIATALDFVSSGYIQLEKCDYTNDYIFTIIKNIKATDIEITALKIFFNGKLEIGSKQSLNQFKKIIRNEKPLDVVLIYLMFFVGHKPSA